MPTLCEYSGVLPKNDIYRQKLGTIYVRLIDYVSFIAILLGGVFLYFCMPTLVNDVGFYGTRRNIHLAKHVIPGTCVAKLYSIYFPLVRIF